MEKRAYRELRRALLKKLPPGLTILTLASGKGGNVQTLAVALLLALIYRGWKSTPERWRMYVYQGLSTWVVGLALVLTAVHHYGVDRPVAKVAVSVLMIPVGFALNWLLWRDRSASRLEKTARWWVCWGTFFVFNQTSFSLVTGLGGMPIAQASMMLAPPTSLLSYFIHDRFVFRNRRSTLKADTA